MAPIKARAAPTAMTLTLEAKSSFEISSIQNLRVRAQRQNVNKTLRHGEACKEVQLNFNGGFTYFLLVNPASLDQTIGAPAENRGAVVDKSV